MIHEFMQFHINNRGLLTFFQAAEAQEALEEESLSKVESEVRQELKQNLQGDGDESRSKSRSRYKNVECHYCHKIGHIQRNGFLWKQESKDKNGKQKDKDHDYDVLRVLKWVYKG